MKKAVILILAVMMLVPVFSGCAKDAYGPDGQPIVQPAQSAEPTSEPEKDEPVTTTVLSQNLKMTNDWTIVASYNFYITDTSSKDRVVLGTSAQAKAGEIMWDDSQYWTLAVITNEGAYNLYAERIRGHAYMEVSEAYINGARTPVITLYIFSGTDREIRNYIYENGAFSGYVEYTTKQFSTGGVNVMYSSLPEPKEQ